MKNVPKLTEYQKEWVRKETAHYIFVDRNENGEQHCYCDCCQKDVNLYKTRHLEDVKCPDCGRTLMVIHKWRKDISNIETIDWIAIPRVVDANTLMLRYIGAHRRGVWSDVFEAARIVFDTRQKTQHYFCKWANGWEYTKRNYFVEHNMYNYREWCCLPAKPYRQTWNREIKKLDCFKYFQGFTEYVNNFYYLSDGLKFIGYKAPLYEKLIKAGYDELVHEDEKKDLNNFGIEYDTKEKSLIKMLGLNRNQFKVLKDNQSFYNLEFIRLFPNITQEYLNKIKAAHISANDLKRLQSNKIGIDKTLAYIKNAGCAFYEWDHYVNLLKSLGYKLDEHYLYPKDFRKADRRVSDEYAEKKRIEKEKADEEKRKAIELHDQKINSTIASISNALRQNKELMEFFSGSNGLQIYVPESATELREEGKALHNCLGTYTDRVAEGKTLIFFVRRIEEPTAPYVALEYCHGRIIQCRYDCNRAVTDEKIISFTEALAARLVSQNILAA